MEQSIQQENPIQFTASLLPKQRHELTRLMQGMFPICGVCQHAQDQIKCDIYISTSQCKTNMCAACFDRHKLQQCLACTLSIESHYPTRRTNKNDIIAQMNKLYNRNKTIRGKAEFEDIEPGFKSVMAYFCSHPKVIRAKYEDLERDMLQLQQYKKQRQMYIDTGKEHIQHQQLVAYQNQQKKRRNVIVGWKRSQKEDLPDMSYGYRSGMALIYRAFGHVPKQVIQ